MQYLSISDFSKRTGIPVRTLHHYDAVGVLVPEYINEDNHYRYYTERQILDCILIEKYKNVGFTLKEIIPLLLENTNTHHQTIIEGKLSELKTKIEQSQSLIKQIEAHHRPLLDDFTLCHQEPCTIAFVREVGLGTPASIRKRYTTLNQRLKDYNLMPIGVMSLINHDDYRNYNPSQVDLEVFVEVSEQAVIEGVTRKLESYSYLNFTHKGGYRTIPKSYQKMIASANIQGLDYRGKTIECYLIDYSMSQCDADYITELRLWV